MRTKSRTILGIASLIFLTGAIVLFAPLKIVENSRTSTDTQAIPSVFSLLNVNKASAKDFEKLPGLGPTKVKAIMEYRRKYGPFKTPTDFLKVKGIGKATLKKLSKFLTGFSTSVSLHNSSNGLVDINSANAQEIASLPFIGPVKAKSIVEYRNSHGPFRSVEDLKKVKGIGTKTLDKIRNLIAVKK